MDITHRVISPPLESLLNQPIKLLDHGFIRVIDYMGNDSAVVQAARVSYGAGTKQVSEDKGLIQYLMRHKHTTPFEMCEIKLHIKMPIFVARQWIRHRTASVNEYSARYSILSKEFYIPKPEHLTPQSTNNKQGRSDETLSPEIVDYVRELLKKDAEHNYESYEEMLNDHNISRELARMNLTLNYYTEMYWKIDLHNLMHFLSLRADSHAQYEIRIYAEALLGVLKAWVPLTYEAFETYKLNSVTLSSKALNVVKHKINGIDVPFEDSEMSKREWNELNNILRD